VRAQAAAPEKKKEQDFCRIARSENRLCN